MLRAALSRARAIVQPFSRASMDLRPGHLNLNEELPKPDTLATTSFSPMNPGVSVSRPHLAHPESPQDDPNHLSHIEALVATSTSCSPANPGPTLPLLSSALTVPQAPSRTPLTHMLNIGSRSRVLEDIPSILKRFDVPKANVLTRFLDAPPTKKPVASPQSTRVATKPHMKSPVVGKTENTPTTATAVVSAHRSLFFRLPAFLRPRKGTTYYDVLGVAEEMEAVGKPNIVQYVLYGNPDPDDVGVNGAGKRTLWQSMSYGASNEGDGEVVEVEGTVIAAKVIGDGKFHDEGKKAGIGKRTEEARTVADHGDIGFGVVAK